ncbi:MAG: acyl-CoA thioesterase, partial [Anaeromyxobacteraceae bacterium]
MVTTQIRVIYGDTDQMGVVYYANYLRFFEAARNEFIRAKGMRYRDFERDYELVLPVVEASVQYKQSARYDDLLTIEIALGEARRASARFDYRVVRE